LCIREYLRSVKGYLLLVRIWWWGGRNLTSIQLAVTADTRYYVSISVFKAMEGLMEERYLS
jgi:hypothetical protein